MQLLYSERVGKQCSKAKTAESFRNQAPEKHWLSSFQSPIDLNTCLWSQVSGNTDVACLRRVCLDAGARALVFVPTRELAEQIFTVSEKLRKLFQLTTASACGGMPIAEQVLLVISISLDGNWYSDTNHPERSRYHCWHSGSTRRTALRRTHTSE